VSAAASCDLAVVICYNTAIGGGAEQPHLQHQLAQLQRELEAVKLEAESVRVERDELKDQNDEVCWTIQLTLLSCKMRLVHGQHNILTRSTKTRRG